MNPETLTCAAAQQQQCNTKTATSVSPLFVAFCENATVLIDLDHIWKVTVLPPKERGS